MDYRLGGTEVSAKGKIIIQKLLLVPPQIFGHQGYTLIRKML